MSSDLLVLFATGLAKVFLLNRSVEVTKLLAGAVQSRDMSSFTAASKRAVVIALLGAACSSLASWSESNLAVLWREKLVKQIHDKYYMLNNFYSLQNLSGRSAIVDPEERLSREVFSTTKRLAKIIALLARSAPSLVFFTFKLASRKGVKFALIPLLYYGLA
jgi:ATP-binding cassette subfamily D (ALD) protein 3